MTAKEAAHLPDELKPIVPGGSWFDDMAIKRLRIRHKELKESGRPEGEEDSEEMFIMAKLKDPEMTSLLPQQQQQQQHQQATSDNTQHQHQHSHHQATPDQQQPTPSPSSTTTTTTPSAVAAAFKTQDTREALRSFLRHRTQGGTTTTTNRHNINHHNSHPTSNDPISSSSSSSSSDDTTTKEFMEVYERELHSFFEKFMSAMLQAEIGGVSIENRSEEVAAHSNDVNNP
ncbi:hypothetical protein Pmani_032689 [Petrolisthes manimaculis]|uniref:Uncharacterized protein n=1 Tax=Petrolisthes manimaculis TaxID=1843537 RepID=A0AAE1NRC3_9EUCA|nr:hypothetical protein Pmani_032689 [Petrolisthes manimaculis]